MEDVISSREKKDLLFSFARSTSSTNPYAKPHLPNVFQGILMRKRIFLFGLHRELPTASSGYGDLDVGNNLKTKFELMAKEALSSSPDARVIEC